MTENKITTIGIIGAQGKFGQELVKKINSLKESNLLLLPSKDKLNNKEIIEKSDVIILTVRKEDTENILNEIKIHSKDGACIISFVFGYNLEKLQKITKKEIIKLIADPWWNFLAYLKSENFPENIFNNLVTKISKKPLIYLRNETKFFEFTLMICYLFVVLLLYKLKQLNNINNHLFFLSKKIKIDKKTLINLKTGDNPNKSLIKIITKGGISEKFLKEIKENKKIKPKKIFGVVKNYFIN
jgi:hypothetical protein